MIAPSTLTEIVAGLTLRMQYHLTYIRIGLDGGEPVAHLSIALFDAVDDEAHLAVYGHRPAGAIDVDTNDLEDGITITAMRRWPDVVRPVTMDIDLPTQLHQLKASRIAGEIEAAKYQVRPESVAKAQAIGHPILSWLITTHMEQVARPARRRGPWWIRARYHGRCSRTGQPIRPGTPIVRDAHGGWMLRDAATLRLDQIDGTVD